MQNKIRSDSPDQKHTAALTFVEEIRFGPMYYSLEINGQSFGKRIFGDRILWSPDSTIVCLQEWHNTVYSRGPKTSLLLIRLTDWRSYAFPIVNGFSSPEQFVGADDTSKSLVLKHNDSVGAQKVTHETEIDELSPWQTIEY